VMPGTRVRLRRPEHMPLCRASTSSFGICKTQDVDGRDEPGHDDSTHNETALVQCPAPWSRMAPRCSLMRNTIRTNSAAMREKMIPTTTLAIEDNSKMNPPNGLIAIAARPEKMPEMPNRQISAITSQ